MVTAPTGAAVRDIINISQAEESICAADPVSGPGAGRRGAKKALSAGIAMLDRMGVDVIIVGRGGGSMEDLWAFNEEEVARAIFDCSYAGDLGGGP